MIWIRCNVWIDRSDRPLAWAGPIRTKDVTLVRALIYLSYLIYSLLVAQSAMQGQFVFLFRENYVFRKENCIFLSAGGSVKDMGLCTRWQHRIREIYVGEDLNMIWLTSDPKGIDICGACDRYISWPVFPRTVMKYKVLADILSSRWTWTCYFEKCCPLTCTFVGLLFCIQCPFGSHRAPKGV